MARAGADPLGEGKRVLESLEHLEVGESREACFQMVLGERVVGWATVSLKCERDGERSLYRYRAESRVSASGLPPIYGLVEATLDEKFAPLRMRLERTVRAQEGQEVRTVEMAEIGGDKVKLTKLASTGETSKEVAAPSGLVVFGLEMLLQVVKLDDVSPFGLREFDPQTGAAPDLRFAVAKESDGSRRVNVTRETGQPHAFYVFDAEGRLSSFGESGAPFVAKRVSEDKLSELKQSIGTDP